MAAILLKNMSLLRDGTCTIECPTSIDRGIQNRMTSKTLRLTLLALSITLLVSAATAQSNELAIQAGGYFPVDSQIGAGDALVVGGSFAHRLVGVPLVSAYVEVPVFATFNSTTNVVQTANGKARYSSLFVTPGVKVKLAPEFPISPCLVAGGGVAHFSKSHVTGDDSTYSGTFDVGGGLDWKIFPFFSARGEVRDFYTGSPDILSGFDQREHQLVATVGLVFRF